MKDIERFASIVREYHRQDGSTPEAREERTKAYRDACDTLQDEIRKERMETAREEYEERGYRQAESREAAWIEEHYK